MKIREKKIKSLKAVIGLGLVSAVVMAGMFPISAALGTDYSRQTITMAQAAGKYKTQGRTGAVGTGLTMDWSGSGIEFNADCEGDVYLNMKVQSSWKHAYITAVVDGKRMPRIEAKTNSTGGEDVKLEVASGLAKGEHSIGVYNETECSVAVMSAESIELSGQLTDPPKNNDKLIEYVGDSYLTGYGDLIKGNDSTVDFNDTALISDGAQSLGVLTANKLHADYSVLAVSGYGLTCGVYGLDSNMPKYYDYISWERSHTPNAADQWNFSRPADIVVVELGDNDGYFATGCGITNDDFQAGAKSFIQRIRSKNPNAKIVWIMYGYNRQIKNAVNELGGAGAGLYTTTLALGNSGVFGHPSVDEIYTAADTLASYLNDTVISPKPSTTALIASTTSIASATSASEDSTTAYSSTTSTSAVSQTAGSTAGTGTTVPSADTSVKEAPKTGNTPDFLIPCLIGVNSVAVLLAFVMHRRKETFK